MAYDKDQIRRKLIKLAKEAFETACTITEDKRIEVYLLDGKPERSDILYEDDEIVYGPNRILCYQVFGHDYLEPEIKTWIDLAREIPEPKEDEPTPEPTEIEKSIREMVNDLAKTRGVHPDDINSFEVFANLPVDALEQIESAIIEYWWDNKEEEDGKTLATAQIDEAIADFEVPEPA